MRILTNRKLTQLLKKAFEDGVSRGYDLGWQMGQVERRNRGMILAGYEVQKEVDNILRKAK